MRARSFVVVGLVSLAVACGNRGAADRFAPTDDASVGPDGSTDTTLDDVPSVHPDGDPTLGGPCNDDTQCARPSIPCATFTCDLTLHRCRATPDDTKCDDGIYCDGAEKCDPRSGCVPGPVIDCSSGDTCMIDRCVEETHGCTHTPRDADADGDPTNACPAEGGGDCDDHDPTVNSKTQEVCGNGKDDNCNGSIDESPCLTPAHSTCGDALLITTDGTYPLSLAGTSRSVGASCAPSASYARQAVAAVRIPAGGPQDVDLVASASGAPLVLASAKLCGDSTTENGCVVQPTGATSVRLKLRALDPGTYPIYVFGSAESSVELKASFLPPTPPATNLDCTTASPLLDGTTTTALVDASLSDVGTIPTACATAAGPLVYRVTIPSSLGARDLDVRVTAGSSGVRTVVGLRDAGCLSGADELRCGSGDPAHFFARVLPPGTYFLTIGASAPTDLTISASLSPPTAPPSDASCTGAPSLPTDTTILVDLSSHEGAIPASCVAFGSSPPLVADAAYAFSLSAPSDVLVVAHPSGSDVIGLGLASPACTTMDYGCGRGYPTRLVRRALAAGDYRVVVESENMSTLSLSTFIRTPAATPGPEGADACGGTDVVIPPTGGLFVGSTAGKSADYDESCDTSGLPKGGAPDVVYRLDLPTKSRLIVDMAGSAFTTTLSIRHGATCPGVEITDGCAAGFVVDNAFLDKNVDAGTYWIFVDGYSLSSGSYRMDVRVAPPLP